VLIKENVKYAIRLRNRGGRTSNGDGGLSVVKGADGTTFTFTACSLSFNGNSLICIGRFEKDIIINDIARDVLICCYCRYNANQRPDTTYLILLKSTRFRPAYQ
jgi:hypothetical protein